MDRNEREASRTGMSVYEWAVAASDLVADVHAICAYLIHMPCHLEITEPGNLDGPLFGEDDLAELFKIAGTLLERLPDEVNRPPRSRDQPAAKHETPTRPRRTYARDRCMEFLCEIFSDDRAMWRRDCQRKVAKFLISEGLDPDVADGRADEWCDLYLVGEEISVEADLPPDGGLDDAINGLSDACRREIDPDLGY
jgi:hypothetical protein